MTRGLLVSGFALLALLASGAEAQGKTFVVTKRGDPVPGACTRADCSLREAVQAANARPGRDVVELPNRRRPYNLSRPGSGENGALDGDLDISDNPLVIKHPGRGRATVRQTAEERVFEVFDQAPTTFRKLVITGGTTTGLDSGGGIHSDAVIKVIGSRVAGNSSARRAGGINLSDDAGLRLVRSTVARNTAVLNGGGIDVNDSLMRFVRSRIVANRSMSSGGGVYNDSVSKPGLRIDRTTIAGNRSVNDAGGLYLSGDDSPVRIVGSTISGNRSGEGGGLFATVARPIIVNSTVAGNRATDSGGGILAMASSEVLLNAVTVARNVADSDQLGGDSGGGLYRDGATSFEVENSLIALNRLGGGLINDCDGDPFDSLGHNLRSGGPCNGFDTGTDTADPNPRIGKLRQNGGPTRTIALRRGSPAINMAKRSTAPNRDQRGERRGRKRDIGAYERNTR